MARRKKAPDFSYEGVFFDKDQIDEALSGIRRDPLPDETKNYHVTCAYRPDAFHADLVGHTQEFEIVAYGNDGRTEGLLVRPCDPDSPEATALNEIDGQPHITLAVDRSSGAEPVDCGQMEFDTNMPEKTRIRGTFGMFDRESGRPVTDRRDLPTPDKMPPVVGEQLRMEGIDETLTHPERMPRPDADRRRAVLVDVAIHRTRRPDIIRVSVPTRRAGSYVRDDGETRALHGSIFVHRSCVTPNKVQTEPLTLGTVKLHGDHKYTVSYKQPHPSGSIHAAPVRKTCEMTGWQLRHENEAYGIPADTRLERERTRQWQESLQPSLFQLENDVPTDEKAQPQPPSEEQDRTQRQDEVQTEIQ